MNQSLLMRHPTALIAAMRPLHWIKNLLLLVPMTAGHRLADQTLWPSMIGAIVSFCLLASAMYLLNDVVDRRSDAAHPVKRRRPVASGALSIGSALTMCVLLLAGGLLTAIWVSSDFFVAALCYLIVTCTYSYYLKTKPIMDVLCLAGLYCLRILAGGVAVNIFPSAWLLAFGMFLFLSLAFSKRHTELLATNRAGDQPNVRRGYMPGDQVVILMAGLGCGLLAVLVLALYINSNASHELYRQPRYLWLMCPILLYWITRLWLLAERGALPDDPVMFAIRDRVTWLAIGLTGAIFLLATH